MKIQKSLEKFGLVGREGEIFCLLIKNEWSTVLGLSKRCEINRTTIYRVLESLEKKGFVQVQIDDKTTYYRAVDLKRFDDVIAEKKNNVNELEEELKTLKSEIGILSSLGNNKTSVQFYRGINGLKSLVWKTTKKDNEKLFWFGKNDWYEQLGEKFADRVREEKCLRKIKSYELQNRGDDEPIPNNFKVSWTNNVEYLKKYYFHRQIDGSIFKIYKDLLIRDEGIALFSFSDDEVVGIEISNKDYSDMFKQVFISNWNRAKSIDSFGGEDL